MRNRNNVLLSFCLICITACNSPSRLAINFIEQNSLPSILYISQPAIFVQFYRPEEALDSISYYKPEKIMYFLDDSIVSVLKEQYDSLVMQSLREAGFSVYDHNNLTQFFGNKGLMWQLSPVQITFEEHRIWYSDELPFSEYSYYFDTIFSEYQFNVWYELSPVNGDSTVPVHMLFSSVKDSDRLRGRFIFDWNLKSYRYVYDFYESDSLVFLNISADAAKKHANYLYDFFLNRYLYFNSSGKNEKYVYYTFDREKRKIEPARDNRFIFIQNER